MEVFERLAISGLAIKNEDIQLQTILEKIKLKEINDILYGKTEKPFRKKEEALKFIFESPDIKHIVNKIFLSYQFYKLIPLNINYNKFKEVNEYFSEVAELIAHTYIMGGYAAQHKAQSKNLSRISGWKISPTDDGSICKFCQKMSKKSYPKNQYPKVPLHIGCRCGVFPKMK
ncbi:MAG: hypothetical protein FJ134_11105 [Deltaproteobacteria bacterium]|nr:hypothetical protein [Deltaproteobacteria bacterium]